MIFCYAIAFNLCIGLDCAIAPYHFDGLSGCNRSIFHDTGLLMMYWRILFIASWFIISPPVPQSWGRKTIESPPGLGDLGGIALP